MLFPWNLEDIRVHHKSDRGSSKFTQARRTPGYYRWLTPEFQILEQLDYLRCRKRVVLWAWELSQKLQAVVLSRAHGLVMIKSKKNPQLLQMEWALQLFAPVLPVVLCRIFLGRRKEGTLKIYHGHVCRAAPGFGWVCKLTDQGKLREHKYQKCLLNKQVSDHSVNCKIQVMCFQ